MTFFIAALMTVTAIGIVVYVYMRWTVPKDLPEWSKLEALDRAQGQE